MSAPIVPNDPAPREPSGKEVYNIVTDVATGMNVRMWDNAIQAATIAICFILGVVIGCLAMSDRITGGVLGGFLGILAGLFGSGIFLMVFRAIRHARGKHD